MSRQLIHDLSNKFDNNGICPFCFTYNLEKATAYYQLKDQYGKYVDCGNKGISQFYSVICSPAKRYYWRKWFKKLYCSISGYHKHYNCKNCLTHWIIMLEAPDNPIGYLPG